MDYMLHIQVYIQWWQWVIHRHLHEQAVFCMSGLSRNLGKVHGDLNDISLHPISWKMFYIVIPYGGKEKYEILMQKKKKQKHKSSFLSFNNEKF